MIAQNGYIHSYHYQVEILDPEGETSTELDDKGRANFMSSRFSSTISSPNPVIGIIWFPSVWNQVSFFKSQNHGLWAHELVARATDTSTIQAQFTKSRYIPTHQDLKFSTSTLEWPMSWKLSWPAGDQGPLWRLWCFPTRGTEGIYQCTGTSS